jgi:hypothetical protein
VIQRMNGISNGECKEWNRGRLWLADEQMVENNVWKADLIYQLSMFQAVGFRCGFQDLQEAHPLNNDVEPFLLAIRNSNPPLPCQTPLQMYAA